MICKQCGSEMFLNEKDCLLEGCYDNYWHCPRCSSDCIEEVILDQNYREIWSYDDGKNFKTYFIQNLGFKSKILD